MKPVKFYVVWKGRNPGIYYTWPECKQQIDGFPDARYKSYENLHDAQSAFNGTDKRTFFRRQQDEKIKGIAIVKDALCVDAACAGNPGIMEYRGVWFNTREVLFHCGPFPEGTNNVGEFLAVVHALALLKKQNSTKTIYTDSANAMIWVEKKACRTKLVPNAKNAMLFDKIRRAEKWLHENTYENKIFKWQTDLWGEIPADFGRK
jgi:ribonuclease HI